VTLTHDLPSFQQTHYLLDSLEQRANYKRPAEFDEKIQRENGRDPVETYFTRGEKVIARMKNPPNKEDVHHNSFANLQKWGAVTDKEEALDAVTAAEWKAPSAKLKMDLKKKWRHVKWTVNGGDSIISDTYFDTKSHTLVSSTSNNTPLKNILKHLDPPIGTEGLPFHSELWTTTYRAEIESGAIQYIMRNNIANTDTARILRAARRLLNPKAKDTDVVEINIDSDKIEERDSFIALAGTDNGATVFRMLADSHNLFQGRQVVRVWTWDKNRGQNPDYPEFNLPLMVWEIAMVKDPGSDSDPEVLEKPGSKL
jgi:hypothetical protein